MIRFAVLALGLSVWGACNFASQLTCDSPATVCSPFVCAILDTDPNHCGRCDNPCSAGESCVAGQCVCPAGTTRCGTLCASLSTDSLNCGACGVTCASGLCSSGACSP